MRANYTATAVGFACVSHSEWVIFSWLTCTDDLPKASDPFELHCASSLSRTVTHELCFSGCHMTHLQIRKSFFPPRLSWLKSRKFTSSYLQHLTDPGWLGSVADFDHQIRRAKGFWSELGPKGKVRLALKPELWAMPTCTTLLKQVV